MFVFAYIKGIITEIGSTHVVIENNGIGYLVLVALPEKYQVGKEVKIFLYQYVREDENSLYGFDSKEEKDLFLRLIDVKGVGCKMALGMFTGEISGIIDAIERENILYLKKFPKIGEKVARQIILDLKGKLVSTSDTSKKCDSEVVEALKSLGYKPSNINRVISSIDTSKTVEEQIKEALKLMLG